VKRIKFTVAGKHPLLYLVRDYFIQSGEFELVPWAEQPDLCIYGAALCKGVDFGDAIATMVTDREQIKNVPIVVLSTSSMYNDRARVFSSEASDPYPMRTADPCLVDAENHKGTYSLIAEHMFAKDSLIVRPFNVYGQDIKQGVIPKFIKMAKREQPLPIRGHGYQTRCFMYQDDFLSSMKAVTQQFHEGKLEYGALNLGTTEQVSINRLADSVWKLVHRPTSETQTTRVPRRDKSIDVKWKLPELSYFLSAPISLRKGLWNMLQ
jgi:nucleoside-diphosphate-sugar epimerase